MSIASQITALGNNIGAAYNMINQRGGTIPTRKNAENIATAIATIPSGSCPPQKDYGVVTYQPIITTGASVTQKSKSGTFSWAVPNTKKLLETMIEKFGLMNESDGNYSCSLSTQGQTSADAKWTVSRYVPDGTQKVYSLSELSNIFGINITGVANTGSKSLSLKITVSYDTATTISITNKNDYNSLGSEVEPNYNSFQRNAFIRADDTIIYRNQITGYSFGTDCDYIPGSFLSHCYRITSLYGLETLTVTVIPDEFLSYCSLFNQQITLPSTVTRIGGSFLEYCKSFDYPIDLLNVTLISPVMSGNASLLTGCTAFNSLVTAQKLETFDGTNQGFLNGCTQFNQPVSLPKLKTVPDSFLYNCTSFNQTISIPEATSIGNSFLRNCSNFNQQLVFPNTVTSISSYFMYQCLAFNQPLTLPSSLTSIGGYFLNQCNGFTGILDVATSVSPTDNYSLSTSTVTAPCYTTGITVKGSQRNSWLSNLPDRTSSPYRKLIDGGAS